VKRLLAPLGSLAITFPALVALAAGLVACYALDAAPRWVLSAPLLVLTLNLLAALVTHPRLRRQAPLLIFHLCLLGALVLSLAALLTKLEARVEMLAGAALDPEAVVVTERGVLHPAGAIERLRFVHHGFRVDYAPGLLRGETRATVSVTGARGEPREVSIGDTRALVQAGFRTYTTSNKGFAAVLSWEAAGAAPERGAVHFPSYPLRDWKQVTRWRTPAGDALELELQVPAAPARTAWRFDSGRVPLDLPLRVRGGYGEHTLAPGDWLAVAGGRLRYEGSATWMGYRIAYDPTLPWLLACGIVGALALGWHFLRALPAPAGRRATLGEPRAAGA
jgi:cytochrome c biogenesis protein